MSLKAHCTLPAQLVDKQLAISCWTHLAPTKHYISPRSWKKPKQTQNRVNSDSTSSSITHHENTNFNHTVVFLSFLTMLWCTLYQKHKVWYMLVELAWYLKHWCSVKGLYLWNQLYYPGRNTGSGTYCFFNSLSSVKLLYLETDCDLTEIVYIQYSSLLWSWYIEKWKSW